jgi:hypothetical protein
MQNLQTNGITSAPPQAVPSSSFRRASSNDDTGSNAAEEAAETKRSKKNKGQKKVSAMDRLMRSGDAVLGSNMLYGFVLFAFGNAVYWATGATMVSHGHPRCATSMVT